MDCLRLPPLPISIAQTPGFDNPVVLPDGFHWNPDQGCLSLRGAVVIRIEPSTSPVTLIVIARGGGPEPKYFVSHEMAIRYALRWATKWEAEIRLRVGNGVAAVEGRSEVKAA